VERVIPSAVVAVFALVIAAAVVKAARPAFGGARSWTSLRNYGTANGLNNWVSPALLIIGLEEAGMTSLSVVSWWIAPTVAFFLGVASQLADRDLLRALRDILFSILGAYISVMLLMKYLARDLGDEGLYLLSVFHLSSFLALFAAGLLLNFWLLKNIPKLGISLLGAIDVLLFLLLPFSVDIMQEVGVEMTLLLTLIAGLLGFAAATAPDFILLLGGIAIIGAQIVLNVVLGITGGWTSDLDWTGALMILGTSLGVGAVVPLRPETIELRAAG
jgi:hypothetical protein